jgi:hypothetical protein
VGAQKVPFLWAKRLFGVFYGLAFEFFLADYTAEVISFAFVGNFEFGSIFV